MMSCEEFSEKVTAYLEGRVPYGQRLGMMLHSIMCVHCRTYLRQMSEVIKLSGEIDEASPPDPEQKERLMEAFRAANESGDS